MIREALFWVAVTGTVTSAIFCSLVSAAAFRFHRRRLAAHSRTPAFTPPVSLLKPLHGAESGLAENVESFFRQEYPAPTELLFCARHEEDAGLAVARRVAERYPMQAVRFLVCGEPRFPNPKMYSLAVMSEAAAYPHLVASDADAHVSPHYLLRAVQALAPGYAVRGKECILSSSLYLGCTSPGASLFTRLDALGKTVEMGAGVLVADMLSGTDFALGPCMALRRDAFQLAGGYEELGQYWAEDFVLGHRLAARGCGVEMSTEVIDLFVADQGAWSSLRDQLRWMQSTRRSRPWGHLGTGLTFAMPFGLLGCAASLERGAWTSAALFLAIASFNRMIEASAMLYALGANGIARGSLLYPLRDLLGFLIWCGSYLPADTRYHGTRFRIQPDGRLKAT